MKKIMLSLLMSTLLFGEAFAADEKVYFSPETGMLQIPKVYVRNASGEITAVVSAELTIIKATEPYELKVDKLGAVANEPEVDEFGCVFPLTWHAAMNHCMNQQ